MSMGIHFLLNAGHQLHRTSYNEIAKYQQSVSVCERRTGFAGPSFPCYSWWLCCAVLCCATNCTTMITNYIPHLIRRNKCRCGCKCNCIGHLKKETNKQASYFPTRGSRISRDYGLITSHHMSGMLSESIDPICSNQTYSLSILHAPLLSLDDVCIGYCSTAMRHRPSIPSTN